MLVHSLLLALAFTSQSIDTTGWKFTGEKPRIEQYRGKDAIALRNTYAQLPVTDFMNGTIEFDIAIPDSASFTGVEFRLVDVDNYEEFYLRPAASGQIDATQYSPVFFNNSGWQIYTGEAFTRGLKFRHYEWMHMRIVVKDARAAVYLDSDTISQYIPRLLRDPVAGGIALYSRNATTHFANLRITKSDDVDVPVRTITPAKVPDGVVSNWMVSQIIADSIYAKADVLSEAGLKWTAMKPTERGIVNLGVVGKRSQANNTIVAKFEVQSATARRATLKFGFSDRVRVYVNGKFVYAGNDVYVSRDYRFLGTVGLYDEVPLDLKAGPNTITFVVGEVFGGWAVTAVTP